MSCHQSSQVGNKDDPRGFSLCRMAPGCHTLVGRGPHSLPDVVINTLQLADLLGIWRVIPDCPEFSSRLCLPRRNHTSANILKMILSF